MSDELDKITKMMKPIDEQITLCTTGNEQIMLACGMMQRVKEILTHHLGADPAKNLLQEFVDDEYVS